MAPVMLFDLGLHPPKELSVLGVESIVQTHLDAAYPSLCLCDPSLFCGAPVNEPVHG